MHSPIDASEAQICPGLPLFDEGIDNRYQEKSLLGAGYPEAEPTLSTEHRAKPGRYRGGDLHITLWKASSSGSDMKTATDQQMTQ
jgi:hypothetical protein